MVFKFLGVPISSGGYACRAAELVELTLPYFQTDSLTSDIAVLPFITKGTVVCLAVLSTILRPPLEDIGASVVADVVLDWAYRSGVSGAGAPFAATSTVFCWASFSRLTFRTRFCNAAIFSAERPPDFTGAPLVAPSAIAGEEETGISVVGYSEVTRLRKFVFCGTGACGRPILVSSSLGFD